MSEETQKPQSWWTKPRYSNLQVIGYIALFLVIGAIVAAVIFFLMALNAGMQ